MKKILFIIGLLLIIGTTGHTSSIPDHIAYLASVDGFVDMVDYNDNTITVFDLYGYDEDDRAIFGTMYLYYERVHDDNLVVSVDVVIADHYYSMRYGVILYKSNYDIGYYRWDVYDVEFMEIADGTKYTFFYSLETGELEYMLVPVRDGILD